eukprot:362655-Chlamydomonas_euryale.AAC.11
MHSLPTSATAAMGVSPSVSPAGGAFGACPARLSLHTWVRAWRPLSPRRPTLPGCSDEPPQQQQPPPGSLLMGS